MMYEKEVRSSTDLAAETTDWSYRRASALNGMPPSERTLPEDVTRLSFDALRQSRG
jgi:hypothetical protein